MKKKAYLWAISAAAAAGLVLIIVNGYGTAPGNRSAVPGTGDETGRSVSVGSLPVVQDGITFKFTVEDIGDTIHSAGMFQGEKTNGTWSVAYLSETNNADSTIDVITSKFRLVDQQGRMFDPSAWYVCGDKTEHDYYNPGVTMVLKPDIECRNGILFETSKDSTGFNLVMDYTLFDPN